MLNYEKITHFCIIELQEYEIGVSCMGEKKMTSIGGQAVIEGIMMRGPEKIAVAVRKPDGDIIIDG